MEFWSEWQMAWVIASTGMATSAQADFMRPIPRITKKTRAETATGSPMALAGVVTSYLENAPDRSWQAPLLAYRSRMQSELDDLDATAMPDECCVTSHLTDLH